MDAPALARRLAPEKAVEPEWLVGDAIQAKNASWSFSGEVARNFDAHVERSVPMYREGHELVLELSDYFIGSGSLCYELGCSTGSLTYGLAKKHASKSARFIGIDCEQDMVTVAKERCRELRGTEILCANACDYEFEKADLIVAYYTIQFVPTKYRQALLERIYAALNWGGAFVMFEKVRAPDARFQDIASQVYAEYKLTRGYTPDEVIGKSRSLKGVLEPFSTQGNLDLLKRAGFVDVNSVMKYVCFEGILAIK